MSVEFQERIKSLGNELFQVFQKLEEKYTELSRTVQNEKLQLDNECKEAKNESIYMNKIYKIYDAYFASHGNYPEDLKKRLLQEYELEKARRLNEERIPVASQTEKRIRVPTPPPVPQQPPQPPPAPEQQEQPQLKMVKPSVEKQILGEINRYVKGLIDQGKVTKTQTCDITNETIQEVLALMQEKYVALETAISQSDFATAKIRLKEWTEFSTNIIPLLHPSLNPLCPQEAEMAIQLYAQEYAKLKQRLREIAKMLRDEMNQASTQKLPQFNARGKGRRHPNTKRRFSSQRKNKTHYQRRYVV
jgi:hypothetical protein